MSSACSTRRLATALLTFALLAFCACFRAYVECGFIRDDVCRGLGQNATPLKLISISPIEGSSGGDVYLTLIGEGFENSLEVYLGEEKCKSVRVESETIATCLTPSGVTGEKRSVRVQNLFGETSTLKDAFTFLPQNQWTTISANNAPVARHFHTAIWTGNKMIVYGGSGSGTLNSGGIYDLVSDSWTTTSTTEAPEARRNHTAIWTGSKMIVFGGNGGGSLNSGGIYDPVSNSWTATSTTNAPEARTNHTAIWTGSKMIVFGGSASSNSFLNSGGIYDPVSNFWTATSTTNAPEARESHTAIWTGSKMIVFGGNNASHHNSGGVYDPVSNSWTATSTTNAPEGRTNHSAIWTGSKMIIFGGYNGSSSFNSGGAFSP